MYHPRLKGNHYEMGYHYGSILFKNKVDLKDILSFSNEQVEYANKCLPIYEKYLPNIMAEVKGFADGLKIKYEVLACFLISLYCFEENHGCSIFTVKGIDNNIYFARNMDMFKEYKKTSESILYEPKDKNIILGHSTAFIVLEDGINEHGLAVALTFLLPKTIGIGINGGFIVRLLLEECKTTKEAISLIKTLPIASIHNIVIADKSGDMAVVECSSNKINIINSSTYLLATNHFITNEMTIYNNQDSNWYNTLDRYNTINKYLQNNQINLEEAKNLISGKYGFVCQYDKKDNFDTIWSVVYDLNNLNISFVEGNPLNKKYQIDNRLNWAINRKTKALKTI